jgi:hypothetical protein
MNETPEKAEETTFLSRLLIAAHEPKYQSATAAALKHTSGKNNNSASTTSSSSTEKELSNNDNADDQYVWYLAYGSNLNPKVLEGRRNVFPVESWPCHALEYKLVFDFLAFPYMEPCFASIAPLDADEENEKSPYLHGVVHRITKEEFEKIRVTEGGGGYTGLGYEVLKMNVTTYDDKTIECITLIWSCIGDDGKKLTENKQTQDPATAANSRGTKKHEVSPSKRYWTLIVDGAKHHDLEPEYQLWLQGIPFYNGPTSWNQWIGWFVSITSFWGLYGIPLMYAGYLTKGHRRIPRWFYSWWLIVSQVLFVLHDWILRPVFGSGVATTAVVK